MQNRTGIVYSQEGSRRNGYETLKISYIQTQISFCWYKLDLNGAAYEIFSFLFFFLFYFCLGIYEKTESSWRE